MNSQENCRNILLFYLIHFIIIILFENMIQILDDIRQRTKSVKKLKFLVEDEDGKSDR